MSLASAVAGTSGVSAVRRLLGNFFAPVVASQCNASGRWYPQPDVGARGCSTTASPSPQSTSLPAVQRTSDGKIVVQTKDGPVELEPARAAPVYAKPRGDGKKFGLVPWKNNTQLADYVLFEESIKRTKLPWNDYSGLTSEERDVYMAHLTAVEERRLSYKDPKTGYTVMTISKLLHQDKCCGNGCRHCPYGHENAPEEIKSTKVWNGAYYV